MNSPRTIYRSGDAYSLDGIMLAVQRWQRATFPQATPQSCVEHLRREVLELQELLARPDWHPSHVLKELADVQMLVWGCAQALHVNIAPIVADKLHENGQRAWGQPDAHGVVEHVRGPRGAR